MTTIEQLNRRLGERLGMVRSGTLPRFKWALATDDEYWGQKLGPVWVLCQWQVNAYSRNQWERLYQGRRKYEGAFHQVQAETALSIGHVPSSEDTDYYIRELDRQMDATEEQVTKALDEEDAQDADKDYAEWVDRVQNCNYSAYDNREVIGYGTRHSAGLPV